jgi:CheY-like chemotaxis protein
MNKLVNILLVEDDEVDIMNVQRAFRKNKISNPLYVVNNGLEALDVLVGKNTGSEIPSPGIILLDINMPKMGGIEFLEELRKHPSHKAIRK